MQGCVYDCGYLKIATITVQISVQITFQILTSCTFTSTDQINVLRGFRVSDSDYPYEFCRSSRYILYILNSRYWVLLFQTGTPAKVNTLPTRQKDLENPLVSTAVGLDRSTCSTTSCSRRSRSTPSACTGASTWRWPCSPKGDLVTAAIMQRALRPSKS